jgi:2-oxoglutarate ferredoxin oxidoreductase subunit beta
MSEVKMADYASSIKPTWCSACGNFMIWTAIKQALVELQIEKYDAVLTFDIGCHGNMSDKIGGYRLHGLHGRAAVLAAGVKLANPKLNVIAFAGDGAMYNEGLNHLISLVRHNIPITLIVHNNSNYGLTTGQASAMTPEDQPMNSVPQGADVPSLNPLKIALTMKPSFLARGFSGQLKDLKELFKKALIHQREVRGFTYIDVLQACPTYNKFYSHKWYLERVKSVAEFSDYDNTNVDKAMQVVDYSKDSEEIATGVLYKNPQKLESILDTVQYKNVTKLGSEDLVESVKLREIGSLVNEFK